MDPTSLLIQQVIAGLQQIEQNIPYARNPRYSYEDRRMIVRSLFTYTKQVNALTDSLYDHYRAIERSL